MRLPSLAWTPPSRLPTICLRYVVVLAAEGPAISPSDGFVTLAVVACCLLSDIVWHPSCLLLLLEVAGSSFLIKQPYCILYLVIRRRSDAHRTTASHHHSLSVHICNPLLASPLIPRTSTETGVQPTRILRALQPPSPACCYGSPVDHCLKPAAHLCRKRHNTRERQDKTLRRYEVKGKPLCSRLSPLPRLSSQPIRTSLPHRPVVPLLQQTSPLHTCLSASSCTILPHLCLQPALGPYLPLLVHNDPAPSPSSC